MYAWTDKLSCFFNRIHKIEEWITISQITKLLFSYVDFLKEESKKTFEKPPVIIFDLDNTLLNSDKLNKFPILEGIEPTITFYNFVKDLGFHTIIITGRKEELRERTVNNLNRAKIINYEDLIMRKKDEEGKEITISKFKCLQRKILSKEYTIIANVGDQLSDFEGGYNGKIIKVPNCCCS
jgi:predicted secreted acid phosphatase